MTTPDRRGRVARCAAGLLIAAATCGTISTAAAPASADAPAASHPAEAPITKAVAFQLNTKHDGSTHDPLFASAPSLQWSTELGGPIKYPLIADGKVFVDVGNVVGAGKYVRGTSVSAFDLASGALSWGPIDIGGEDGFGAIAYDAGRIFALNGDGLLHAFDAESGDLYWSTQLPDQWTFSAPPTALLGKVYTSGTGFGGTFYAVDQDTGSVSWTADVLGGHVSSPAVNHRGAFVSYACKQAYRFSASGVERWHHATSCSGGGGRTAVLHAGSVYVRDPGEPSAVLSQKTGHQLRTFDADLPPAFNRSTMVTVTDGLLQAFEAKTGELRWTNTTGPYVTAPIIVNRFVIAGDSGGTVRILRASDGVAVWSGEAGALIAGSEDDVYDGVTGLAEAAGHLVVPAGTRLAVFAAD